MGTQLPSKKGAEPPIFDPCLLWPDGWMDQDGTWHGVRPWSSPYCARWGHSSPPPKGLRDIVFDVDPATPRKNGTPTPTQLLVHVYCGQMAGWMKTPLGTEVDHGPGHIILAAKGPQQLPYFRPMSIVATVARLSYC